MASEVMKILAFDTSTSACSVALQNGDNIVMLHEIAPMQHAQLILPMMKTLLSNASFTFNDLDAIAYGCGPGSFTGIRLASSVAQAIGFASQKPIIPISSLAILAQTAYLEHPTINAEKPTMLVAVDARMSQLYWAVYAMNEADTVELMGKEQLTLPSEVKIPENDDKMCGIGNGWEMYKETFVMPLRNKPMKTYASQFPSAKALLQLAKEKFGRGEWVAASSATPSYLERE